jgi:predicted P-loop ATPase
MISLFKSAKSNQSDASIEVDEYFDGIKNGRWQDEVLNYRAGRTQKELTTCVTASGSFKQRAANKLLEHSGFICLDIDAKDQIAEVDIERIKRNEYVYAVHRSLSGNGYAVFIRIDGARHLDAFLSLEQYFMVQFSIVLDKICKDTSRLRFVSYDPDIYINKKSKQFKTYLKKKDKPKPKPVVIKTDFDEMVVKAAPMNLFDNYEDYIRLAFALTQEFSESGRNYFHSLCQASPKYSHRQAERDYNVALQRSGTGVSIASVYYIFRQAGISTTSERTEKIKSIVKLSDNPQEALKMLNIPLAEAEAFIPKSENTKEKNEIDNIIELIKLNNVKFNEITRNFEFNGEEMTDRILANFYTKVWQKIDDGISKDKVFTLIQNKDNSTSYNPIKNWFEHNSHLTTDNEFDKLKKCFEIEQLIYENDGVYNFDDYLDTYLKKWLLGLIGSAYGTYSLMILVIAGEQGIKKTEFFRNLLPKKLRKFYAESNLDEGKDSEILMTKKWLIVDDEFGGKSKKDATKLKRMSSQQTFSIRMPYGRVSEDLLRLAVLGGTSNDAEVINDPTGNRRIIPINLISFDFEAYMAIDKDKLFIELYNEWKSDKEAWFLTKREIEYLNKANEKNIEVMSEVELINRHIQNDPTSKMTNTDVILELQKLHPTFKTNTKRMGQALKKCGYFQQVIRTGSKTIRAYEIKIKGSVTSYNVDNQLDTF